MRKTVFLILFLFPFVANAQIIINEILSKNVSWNMDDGFNFSNWVELYNPSTSIGYNQTNFYLTDDLTKPTKWKPTSKTILAKSFSILYFERDEIAGHATFKLKPEGGVLYLLNATLTVVDSVIYPNQLRNISWGRKTDNSAEWGFLDDPTPGSSNNNRAFSAVRCNNPTFILPGGFYTTAQQVRLSCDLGDTIYYTTNYTEPTRNSILYVNPITLYTTSAIRAKVFKKGKLSSDVVTATYFINQRKTNLPIVSVVTNPAYLFDAKIGIYTNGDGTNGKIGNGASTPMNWNVDWDRPVNYEFYDTTNKAQLNQELDIKILGGWTRAYSSKSIAICPKKKFGDNRLRYDFFAASKPNHLYKDIQMRNSGNDFSYSMMRDGMMQSIVMNRLPGLNYMAYEPAVLYLNGIYWGIENLRERSNEDWVFSNYGLDEEDVITIEATIDQDTDKDIATDTGFVAFSNYLKDNDVTQPAVYDQVCQKMDVNNFMAYMMAEIYTGNNDWPHNNVKMWRKKDGGVWRWLLSDLDFGMNLYSSLETANTLAIALGESASKPDWATVVLRRLILNETFRNTFIDRYAIHLSTTFKTERVNLIMDSLAAKIAAEINYHKAKFGSSKTFSADITNMKVFSAARPINMLNFISKRFCSAAPLKSLQLTANVAGASYTLNGQDVIDASANIQYFQNRNISVEAKPLKDHTFKHWEKTLLGTTLTLVPMGSTWRYFDGKNIPASNWHTLNYPDAGWATGAAQLGYGGKGEVTTIGYGGNAAAKYATSYYRYRATITELTTKSNFLITVFVDDGAAVYVNGTEVGRTNLPTGVLTDSTYASSANNGITTTFSVPASLLKEGVNLIAVEVHQCNATSSDVIFNLSMTYDASIVSETTLSSEKVYTDVLKFPMSLKAIYETTITGNNLEKLSEKSFVPIWPTLVTDGFTVRAEVGSLISVYDLNGRILTQIYSSAEETFIRSEALKPGLYVVRIGSKNYKILKR